MSQREETGHDVHSSETPLHGEHDSQTEAQSLMPQGDINNCPKRWSSRKRKSLESKDPSTSKPPCKPLNSRNLNLDFEDRVSPLRKRTQCGETSDSDASFKSDMSKEDVINFKERRSSLRIRLKCTASPGSNRNHLQGRIIAKKRHSSLKKSWRKLNHWTSSIWDELSPWWLKQPNDRLGKRFKLDTAEQAQEVRCLRLDGNIGDAPASNPFF